MAAAAGLVGALAAACAGAGGGGGRAPAGGDLHTLVAAERFAPAAGAGLRFGAEPAAARLAIGGERRDAVVIGPGEWSWRLRVPPGGRLRAGVQLVPGTATGGGVQTTVTVSADGAREVLEVIRLPAESAGDAAGWVDLDLDLEPWRGREVVVGFRSAAWGAAEREDDEAGEGGEPKLAWAPLRVAAPTGPAAVPGSPPNVLFIVADTLRRDRVSAYADARATTPEIRRLLAGRGLTFESAYAQAPWTPPSVASYLTGRYPVEALAPDGGIAPGVPTLAELLRNGGYRTGAFVANPLLGGEGVWERGFESFFAAGVEAGWTGVRAEELTARAEAWLEGRRGERFFLYVHYVDPHSPYSSPREPPRTADQEVPDAEALRWGRAESTDPERDAALLAARYDGEVRYLDAAVGRLIESLPEATRAETLIVFTSDHGEELFDHGGWGHGRTLYEELIRVPLLMRWDGRLPAGRRIEGTVRLLDLVPTLTAAAGVPHPEGLAGVDLSGALTAGREPPRLGAFAQHLYLGPPRAAAVHDGLKLILFDRGAPAAADHPHLDFAVALDRRLLSRIEVYDLGRDPGERENLAGSAPRTPLLSALEEEIHRRLQGPLSGLRAIVSGLPPGTRLRARLRCAPAPGEVTSYFLAEGDDARIAGDELRLDLAADEVAKGVIVGSGCGRVEAIDAGLEGTPGGPNAAPEVRLAGARWLGGPVAREALATETVWPPAGGGPALDLWYAAGETAPRSQLPADETLDRLRALGYVGH